MARDRPSPYGNSGSSPVRRGTGPRPTGTEGAFLSREGQARALREQRELFWLARDKPAPYDGEGQARALRETEVALLHGEGQARALRETAGALLSGEGQARALRE